MARLHAYGGDNGTKALSEFDTVDLKALQLARDWGVQKSPQADSVDVLTLPAPRLRRCYRQQLE